MKIVTLFLFLFVTLYAVELSDDEKLFIQNHPEIRVGIDLKWHTIDAIDNDGNNIGISADYLKIISKESGIQFELIELDSLDDIPKALKDKKIDMISSLAKTQEGSKYLLYTTPYISLSYYSFSREDEPRYFKMNELSGKKVTVLKGFMISDWIKENYPAIRVVEALTIYDGLRKVYKNEAAAFINDYSSTHHVLQNSFLPNIAVNAPITKLSNVQIQMGIRNDYPALQSIIDKISTSLSEENVEKLRQKWLSNSKVSMLNFSNDELLWLETNRKLTFTVDPMWLPFEGYDAETMQIFGISHEILSMLSERTDIKLKLIPSTSWSDMKQKVKDKKVQLLPVVSTDSNLDKYMNLSNPYLTIPYMLYGYDVGVKLQSLHSIEGKKVAITDDSIEIGKHLKNKHPNVSVVVVDTREDLIEKLQSKEVDYFITDSASASYIINSKSLDDILGLVKLNINYEPRIAISKELGETALTIINKTIDNFNEAEMNSAYNKWIFVKTIERQDHNRLLKILLSIFVLILVVLFVRYRIRK